VIAFQVYGKKMGSSRRKQVPTFDMLKREIASQIASATSETDAITNASDERIHRVRRRSKRIRAQLQMLEAVSKKRSRRASRRIRDASALLSPFRDSQIVPIALESVRAMLQDSFDDCDAALLKWLADPACQQAGCHRPLPAAIRLAIEHFDRAHKLVRRCDFDKKKRMSAKSLAPVYDLGRCATERILRGGGEDAFHDLRKAVKRHLYQCRFMKAAFPESLGPRIESASRLGDLLGEIQDIAVLQSRCHAAPASIDPQQVEAFVNACEQAAAGRRTQALAMACQLYFSSTSDFVRELKSA
jgi:CHAD domain-containing protein